MELATFIIVSMSLTVVLARAEVLEYIKGYIIMHVSVKMEKPLGSLMYCSQCMGFWIGIILSIFLGPSLSGIPGVDNILLGFVSSYFSSLGDRIIYGISDESD